MNKKSHIFSFKTLTILFALIIGITSLSIVTTAAPSFAGIFGPTEGEEGETGYIMLPDFTTLARELKPAVVNISTKTVVGTGFPFESPFGSDPFGFFDRYFGEMPRSFETQSLGSGFIISSDGYIFTNNHVVENATEITVTLADEKAFTATVIGTDPKTDLALIKIDSTNSLPTVKMGDSDKLEVGEWVVAIGNPFGLEETVTAGIVSAKGRVIGSGPYDDFIQTDASINPGNSGGPLFNIKGEVVGINTAIINQGQGIGFAIPVNIAKDLLPQLKKGEIVRGWLGVIVQEVTPELAESFGLSESRGALISDIEPGSPADKAGLKKGDVILSFNGKKIDKMKELPALVAKTPVGERVTITVFRNGSTKDIALKVGRMPEEGVATGAVPGGGEKPGVETDLGLVVEDVTPKVAKYLGLTEVEGVLVSSVQRGGLGEKAGIMRGDVIKELNHKMISNVTDFEQEMKNSQKTGRYLFLIWRNGNTIFIALNK
jgi:serine protease Do